MRKPKIVKHGISFVGDLGWKTLYNEKDREPNKQVETTNTRIKDGPLKSTRHFHEGEDPKETRAGVNTSRHTRVETEKAPKIRRYPKALQRTSHTHGKGRSYRGKTLARVGFPKRKGVPGPHRSSRSGTYHSLPVQSGGEEVLRGDTKRQRQRCETT